MVLSASSVESFRVVRLGLHARRSGRRCSPSLGVVAMVFAVPHVRAVLARLRLGPASPSPSACWSPCSSSASRSPGSATGSRSAARSASSPRSSPSSRWCCGARPARPQAQPPLDTWRDLLIPLAARGRRDDGAGPAGGRLRQRPHPGGHHRWACCSSPAPRCGCSRSSAARRRSAVVALTLAAPYRMQRFTSWLDPEADRLGVGWQVTQGSTRSAPAACGASASAPAGRSGASLPEAHTDFIFPVIGEELGLLGHADRAGLFGVLASPIFRLSRSTEDPFVRSPPPASAPGSSSRPWSTSAPCWPAADHRRAAAAGVLRRLVAGPDPRGARHAAWPSRQRPSAAAARRAAVAGARAAASTVPGDGARPCTSSSRRAARRPHRAGAEPRPTALRRRRPGRVGITVARHRPRAWRPRLVPGPRLRPRDCRRSVPLPRRPGGDLVAAAGRGCAAPCGAADGDPATSARPTSSSASAATSRAGLPGRPAHAAPRS